MLPSWSLIRDGVQVLNLESIIIMQSNATLLTPQFIGSNHPQLTADTLLGLFELSSWSPEGANGRQIGFWLNTYHIIILQILANPGLSIAGG